MLFAQYSIEREMEVVREEALEEGREEGRAKIRESIMDFLGDLGTVGERVKDRVQQQKDLKTLRQWNKIAARCASIEEFLSKTEH